MAAPDGRIKVDPEVVLRMLIPATKHSEAAHGKKIVLLLGMSGSGKTTAANAFLGKPMRLDDMGNVEVDGPTSDDGLKIGHGYASETIFARVTLCRDPTREGEAVALVDPPGLRDTRSIEHVVVALGSIEMVVRRADEVKAFLVVIQWVDITQSRAPQLRALVEDLALLLRNPAEMARNAVFLVNRLTCRPEEAARILARRLPELRDEYTNKAHEKLLSNPMSQECYANIAAFVNVMIKNTSKIVFFDPLDGGRSVRKVFELLNGIRPRSWSSGLTEDAVRAVRSILPGRRDGKISVEDFNFAGCNEYRKAFNEGVRSGVSDGIDNMQWIRECVARCRETAEGIPRCETQIAAWQELAANLRNLQRDPKSAVLSEKVLKDLKRALATTERDIEAVRLPLEEVEAEKRRLVAKLEELDVDTKVVYEQDGDDGKVYWFLPWGRKVASCGSYTPGSVEFVDLEEDVINGRFHDREYDKKGGVYKSTFRSDAGARPWLYKWATYVRKKDMPGNRLQIENLRSRISALEETCQRRKSELRRLEEEAATTKENIELENLKEKSSKDKLLERLTETEGNVATYKAKITDLRAENENCRNLGLEALERFRQLQPALEVLAEIPNYLDFPTNYVKNFSAGYRQFMEKVPELRGYLESAGDATDLAVPALSNEEPDPPNAMLADPITGEPIRDPVCTESGTVFDACSLIQQFDRNLSEPPPFVHVRGDGYRETIPFMGWKRVPNLQRHIEESTRRRREDATRMKGRSSGSVEEMESQAVELAKEIEALEEKLVIKQTQLAKLNYDIQKKKLEAESSWCFPARKRSLDQSSRNLSSSNGGLDESSANLPQASGSVDDGSRNLPQAIGSVDDGSRNLPQGNGSLG